MGNAATRLLRGVGRAVYAGGFAGPVRRHGRRNPKVLLYHDVAPAEDAFTAGLDCTVTPEMFARHLDWVQRHYTIVPYSDVADGSAPEGSAAITFDDGYRSVYEHAYPALRERGLPATVFLISDVIGNRGLVWVNALNWFLRRHPEIARRHLAEIATTASRVGVEDIISQVRLGYDGPSVEAALAAMAVAAGVDRAALAAEARLYVDWPEIHAMRDHRISFGNHTRTHPNLERLTPEEQYREIAECSAALAKELGPIDALAYPFGHHSAATPAIATRAGITNIGEVGGANRPVRPMAIGRAHISMGNEAALFAQLEVVAPAKAWLRRAAGGARGSAAS